MKPQITITLDPDEAERLSHGLSDLLCWCRGFSAALGENGLDRRPIGIEETREINIKLKKATDVHFAIYGKPALPL